MGALASASILTFTAECKNSEMSEPNIAEDLEGIINLYDFEKRAEGKMSKMA